jgi:O-antigen/teichoic acid export membrane protein
MINRLNKIFPKTGFASNVMTLMTGTVVSQVIAVLSTPILSRLYSPADYGIFSVYLAIVSVAGVFVSARYEQIIVIVKKKSDAINLVVLSLCIVLAVSVLAFISALALPCFVDIEKLLGTNGLSQWIIYLPLSILLLGIFQILECYGIRRKDYKKMRTALVAQSITKVTVNLALGFQTIVNGGLIWGYIGGQLIGIKVLLARRMRLLYRNIRIHFNPKQCRMLARKYAATSFTLISTGLIGSLANYMPVFLFGYFFGREIVGVYSMSFGIVNLPTLVIGKAISDVSYKHTVDIINSDNSLAKYIERIVARLFLTAVLPVLFLALFAKPLFVFLLGEDWLLTGIFTQIMLPYFFFRFLASPVPLFIQTGNTRQYLYWEALFLFLTVASLVFGKIFFDSYMVCIVLLSATNSFCYAVMLYLNFRIAGARLRNVPIEIMGILRKMTQLKKH